MRHALLTILLITLSATVAAAAEFVPAIDASIEGGRRPVLRATTNLPIGTKMLVTVDGPNFEEEAVAEVKPDGKFEAGPFSDGQTDLVSGNYQFAIRAAPPEIQPLAVRAVFGNHGENLAGPQVVREPSPIFGTAVTVLVSVDYRAW